MSVLLVGPIHAGPTGAGRTGHVGQNQAPRPRTHGIIGQMTPPVVLIVQLTSEDVQELESSAVQLRSVAEVAPVDVDDVTGRGHQLTFR